MKHILYFSSPKGKALKKKKKDGTQLDGKRTFVCCTDKKSEPTKKSLQISASI